MPCSRGGAASRPMRTWAAWTPRYTRARCSRRSTPAATTTMCRGMLALSLHAGSAQLPTTPDGKHAQVDINPYLAQGMACPIGRLGIIISQDWMSRLSMLILRRWDEQCAAIPVYLHKVQQSPLRRCQGHISAVWSDACIGLGQSAERFQMQCSIPRCDEGHAQDQWSAASRALASAAWLNA